MASVRTHNALITKAAIGVLCLSPTTICRAQSSAHHDGRGTAEAAVPGTVSPVLDNDPPGYLICTLVRRYFDDEASSDLQKELDLEARGQFLRFLTVGRTTARRPAGEMCSGLRIVSLWWVDDTLVGVYFAPCANAEILDSEANGTNSGGSSEDASVPSAAEMLVEARSLRKQRRFDEAERLLANLREQHPLSPEARRALREMYFVRTEAVGFSQQAK